MREDSTRNDGAAIECRGLTKDYGDGHGVFDLDLDIRRGEVFGFIGANGAGKTTTMRCIMGLIRPDAGTIRVLGLDGARDAQAIKRRVGYLPGELPQYPGVTSAHIIGMLGALRGGVDETRVHALAERLQLDLTRRYAELSHGNRQKVGLVSAFMHSPELLILDEPTLGLDPLMQREVRALVREAVDGGATCLLSSHVLAEVEVVCESIALIRDGRLLRQGSLTQLRTMRVHHLEATLPVAADEDMRTALAALAGVGNVRVDGHVVSADVQGSIAPVLQWLAATGAVELDSRELSLEEVFLAEYASTP